MLTVEKWPKDLSAQRRWKALIHHEEEDKTGKNVDTLISQEIPGHVPVMSTNRSALATAQVMILSTLLGKKTGVEVPHAGKKTGKAQICKALDERVCCHLTVMFCCTRAGSVISLSNKWNNHPGGKTFT